MTKQTSRTQKQVGTLKAALLTGSVVASLAGTYLLGLQEPAETKAAVLPSESISLVVPAEESTAIQLPPDIQGTQLQLQPIQQVVRPVFNPVARTRSSR